MKPKDRNRWEREVSRGLELTRRNLLRAAGVSALVFGGGALSSGCGGPPEDVIDALCDTFIPGEDIAPGTGPGAVEGGMRCFMADVMGQENLDMILQVMGLISPDFHTLSYEDRVAVMESLRGDAAFSQIFDGLHEATAFAFYSELMGQGPAPCGDPSFPGSFPLIGLPIFTEGSREEDFDCS